MLFGVDAIAILHGPEDMPSFFAHELFHIYHRQVMGARLPDPDSVTWWSLWEEGLATYVSQRLNPALSAQQVPVVSAGHGPPDAGSRRNRTRRKADAVRLRHVSSLV